MGGGKPGMPAVNYGEYWEKYIQGHRDLNAGSSRTQSLARATMAHGGLGPNSDMFNVRMAEMDRQYKEDLTSLQTGFFASELKKKYNAWEKNVGQPGMSESEGGGENQKDESWIKGYEEPDGGEGGSPDRKPIYYSPEEYKQIQMMGLSMSMNTEQRDYMKKMLGRDPEEWEVWAVREFGMPKEMEDEYKKASSTTSAAAGKRSMLNTNKPSSPWI
jgi:hypothetical protein